ncbi:hypothetical protein GYA19_00645 [Candidatus Beckwithbacteria bacterium]|nr:hypothetical protein [Candidatus Beckwithbacteria bacterium]
MRYIYCCYILLFLVFLFLFSQAFRLQIIQGKAQSQRAEQNRFRIEVLEAQRGIFYDLKGEPLVAQNDNRNYLYPQEFAHVLGYIGEADMQELTLFGVESGRKVGKFGLERSRQQNLKGTDGGQVQELAASGEKLRDISQRNPIKGRSVQLTIDKDLQNLSFKLLKDSGFKGAIIAGTTDGELLVLASFPSYDPNIFEQAGRSGEIENLFIDKNQPMFNRAIAGLYPPASTFKIITSMAALQEKLIDKDFQVEDTGQIRVGEFSYGNWFYSQYGGRDKEVNLIKALQRSNDIFFYKVGELVGIDKLSAWAKTFGLGELSNIEIQGESQGLVPTPIWKEENMGESWYLGDTYITAIGQGNLQVTPLQVQMMTTAIANNGYLCKPELVVAMVDEKPKAFILTGFEKNNCRQLPVEQQNIALVKEGMEKACESGGTGWPLFEFKIKNEKLPIDNINIFQAASSSAEFRSIPVACKTGTAETGRSIIKNGKEIHLTHAWFTVFAPRKDPEIIITVLLEDAGQGSDKAAPLAREVLKKYFESK